MEFESLHNHTIDTDGHQTHLEVLESAEKYGIGVIAFTDHDMLPTPETIEKLRAYTGPVKWFIGIELSSGLSKELGGADKGLLHILGLFTDPTNKALLAHCEDLTRSRYARMQRMVKRLNELGLTITEEDCVDMAGGGRNVGNPHVVKAVMRHPENEAVMARMMEAFRQAGEASEDIKGFYKQTMADGPKQYPYSLFMKHRSFFPMPSSEISALPDLDTSVRLIREAGGSALLAHPFFNQHALPYDELQKLLEAGRLDGVETEIINNISNRDMRAEVIILCRMAAGSDRLQTVGSDSHDDDDLRMFAKSDGAKRSIGQTAKLIERTKPDLSWSNL